MGNFITYTTFIVVEDIGMLKVTSNFMLYLESCMVCGNLKSLCL